MPSDNASVSAGPPPPLTVVKVKFPLPSVVRTCPFVPSTIDKSVSADGIVGEPVKEPYAPSKASVIP